MEEEIARLIYDRIKSRKNIDNEFITSIIELGIHYFKIEKYSGKYAIRNLNRSIDATYEYGIQFIELNEKLVYSKKNLKDRYIFTTLALLHELTHVKQYSNQKNFNNIEDLIIYSEVYPNIDFCDAKSISFKSKREVLQYSTLTSKFYYYSPVERLAEIDSSNYMLNILKILRLHSDSKKMDIYKLRNYLRGYEVRGNEVIPPTPYYLNKIKCDEYIEEINALACFLSDIAKVRLGLDCPSEVLKDLIQEYKVKSKKNY